MVENGIAIDFSLHKNFHRQFGRKNTLNDFILYIEQLETSENPALDLANLKQLKDYLYNLRPILDDHLPKANFGK